MVLRSGSGTRQGGQPPGAAGQKIQPNETAIERPDGPGRERADVIFEQPLCTRIENVILTVRPGADLRDDSAMQVTKSFLLSEVHEIEKTEYAYG